MVIQGELVQLRPAIASDRDSIYRWLAHSDVTASMMGPPDYPDHPVPTRNEFDNEYTRSFFDISGDGSGRCYVIIAENEDVGVVSYDLLDRERNRAVLDIWMRAEWYCGRGYGSAALKALCVWLHRAYGIGDFFIGPSARNRRAVAAYTKAGFVPVSTMSRSEQTREFGASEYDDHILMIKRL